jgi:type II secretory pathway pseudopilin PulG
MRIMPSRTSTVDRERQLRGFTLLAVLVGVMIVATLAAVALPVVAGASDYKEAQRTALIFRSLDSSLTKPTSNANATLGVIGFCVQVNTKCPKRLYSLTSPPKGELKCSGSASFTGGNSTSDSAKWIAIAPFSGLPIVKDKGVLTPLGWIHDTLFRRTDTPARADLHLDSLTFNQVNYLDLILDGTANASVGRLQYAENLVSASAGQHRYLASFRIAITATWCQ